MSELINETREPDGLSLATVGDGFCDCFAGLNGWKR